MKRIIIMIFIMCVTFPGESVSKSLRIGLLHFPPFGVRDMNDPNLASGTLVDELKSTLKHAGIDGTIRIYPAGRLFFLFGKGAIDFVLISSVRMGRFRDMAVFSDDVILTLTMRAYTADPTIKLPEKKEDLIGKRVAAMNGYLYAGYVDYLKKPENNAIVHEVMSHKSGLLMLLSGRSDFFLDYKVPIESILDEMGPHHFRFSNLLEIKTYFAISKYFPDHETVLKKMVRSYRAQKARHNK